MNKKIPIFYAFARSGGTLVNRCLGSIPDNIVLSEVNPYWSVIPIEKQARDWFSLISEAEYEVLSKDNYVEKINYIAERGKKLCKKLIIRDWVSVNFLANVFDDDLLIPSNVLEQKLYLSQGGFEIVPIVISRNAADVYESLVRTFKQYYSLSIDEFSNAYLEYAKAVQNYPVFHYEDICENPEKSINEICKILDINYNLCFFKKFNRFTHCTGDNTLLQPSRGSQLQTIRSLKSNKESKAYIAAIHNEKCWKANELLKYDH